MAVFFRFQLLDGDESTFTFLFKNYTKNNFILKAVHSIKKKLLSAFSIAFPHLSLSLINLSKEFKIAIFLKSFVKEIADNV